MSVGDICNRVVVSAAPEEPVSKLADMMRRYRVGDLIVTVSGNDGRVPIGIVTDRDIVVKVLAQGLAPDEVTAADVMDESLLVAQESDDVSATLDAMRKAGVRRIPVVDQDGMLSGILTLDDLLMRFATGMTSLAGIAGRQRCRKADPGL